MKKLLSLVIVFVVSLFFMGFTSKEVKKIDFEPITVDLKLQVLPPMVQVIVPESRELVIKEGANAEIRIAYISKIPVRIEVTRQGAGALDENCTWVSGESEVIVRIFNARIENAGKYIVKITNDAGETSVFFSVYVAPLF